MERLSGDLADEFVGPDAGLLFLIEGYGWQCIRDSARSYLAWLPEIRAGLAWFRAQVCLIQAAARGFVARVTLRGWVSLAPKLPAGVALSEVLRVRMVVGKRFDVLAFPLPHIKEGPLGKLARDHLEAVRERPERRVKAKNAQQQRARKSGTAQAKLAHKGPVGRLLEVDGVLYYVKGWNQLPLRLLRKRWVRGPSGSRSLSQAASA